ncbi:YeiH family protein (plasmid) [Ensifer sp. D2-11]
MVDRTAQPAMSTAPRPSRSLRTSVAEYLPGFAVAVLIAISAQFLSEHYGAPATLMALLLGMSLSFLSESGTRTAPGIHLTSRVVLRFGVALLGARVSLEVLGDLGLNLLCLVVAALACTILFAIIVGKISGMDWRLSLLIGGAVAICGASAAVALNAVLPPRQNSDRELALTIVAITLLSTSAMVLYPVVATQLQFDSREAGVFIGGTIHDVAQVVGAGFAMSDETGEIATLVKIVRVSLLAPTIIVMSVMVTVLGAGAGQEPRKLGQLIPGFVLGFTFLAALASMGFLPAAAADVAADLSRWMLLTALGAVGLKTSVKEFASIRPSHVTLAMLATGFLAAFIVVGLLWHRG